MATYARSTAATAAGGQYSLARILGIWALAAIPMGILSWLVFPMVSPDYRTDPIGAGVMRLVVITLGLIWLCVLSLIIVRQEEGDLRWGTVKRRLRLTAPRDPVSGSARRRLWLWVVPLIMAIVGWEIACEPGLNKLWVSLVPAFAEPPGYSMASVFGSQTILRQLVGAWWFLGLYVINAIFNTIVGEEFLFRGVLLPKMEGVFGRWNWVANGVLFGCYHLHQPWVIPGAVISGTLLVAYPSARFRSTWFGIIVHSVQSVYFAFLILGVVLGLA